MRTPTNTPRPFPVAFLLTASLLAGAGCGGKEKIVSVAGRVTHADQPVAGIVVSFVPQAQTETGVSTGTTDEDGRYELTVFKSGWSGAVVGTHKVWVSLPRQPEKPRTHDGEETKKGAARKRAGRAPVDTGAILKKYGRLDKTPLTVEVTGDQPVDLKLD